MALTVYNSKHLLTCRVNSSHKYKKQITQEPLIPIHNGINLTLLSSLGLLNREQNVSKRYSIYRWVYLRYLFYFKFIQSDLVKHEASPVGPKPAFVLQKLLRIEVVQHPAKKPAIIFQRWTQFHGLCDESISQVYIIHC